VRGVLLAGVSVGENTWIRNAQKLDRKLLMKENETRVDNTEEFTCISLCTGYGGIELGLKRVIPTLRTVAYVEREAFAVANLVAKIEEGKMDSAPIWTDVKTFDGRPFRGKVDIITGGYPCQPFSLAGKRAGTEDPRHLWPDIARIIEAVRPVWCFFENVAGHLTLGFPEVYRSLRDMGYSVEAGLFTAAEVGAPHKRQRLFILAHTESRRDNRTTGASCTAARRPRRTLSRESFGTSDVAHSQRPERWAPTQTGNNKPDGAVGERETASRLAVGGEGVADAATQRVQGPEPAGPAQAGGQTDEYGRILWPARPEQPQYEWEEPRVVVDNTKKHNRRSASTRIHTTVKRKPCAKRHKNTSRQGQAQSCVGLSIDGTFKRLDCSACRVDELRLCGNGVVPQQAEKAFRELMRIYETSHN